MGTGGSYPGGKAAGREADYSLPSSAEVKNAWAWWLIKQEIRFLGVVLG
jgi:hypothetical protein